VVSVIQLLCLRYVFAAPPLTTDDAYTVEKGKFGAITLRY
jgi:hypothetical protein